MPNVTFYLPAGQMPPPAALNALSNECVALCTDVLRAALENIHVVYVDVRHGHGRPVFAEIHYRAEPFRTPQVMARFMEALDHAIVRHVGLTARIRCFGYDASHIYARH
jgi:hypothetical protein